MYLLIAMGALFGMREMIFGGEKLMPRYVAYAAALAFVTALFYIGLSYVRRKDEEFESRAFELIRDAQRVKAARSEVKAKIPKNSPRRESPAAYEGATKVGSARSMAALVRKPRLREKILEICDFADMVLETIRRMPKDTPAAAAFAENHLSRLNDALERCFEMNRHDEYKNASESLDAQEIECFGSFITAFRKQQENILAEGRDF
jgi:hypothetical protein